MKQCDNRAISSPNSYRILRPVLVGLAPKYQYRTPLGAGEVISRPNAMLVSGWCLVACRKGRNS
jgi:hypothetical protein